MNKRIPKLKYKHIDASDVAKIILKAEKIQKTFVTEATKILKNEVQMVLEENGKIATGKLIKSISRRVKVSSASVTGTVYADSGKAPYGKKVISGTLPLTKKVSPNTIRRWILNKQRRGQFIDVFGDKALTNVSRMISNKIYGSGIEGFNFLKEAYDRRVDDLRRLGKTIAKQIYG